MSISIEEGRKIIVEAVNPVGVERVPLLESFGRILAEEIKARENVPSFDRSPYDGYAFRSADVAAASKENPVTLKVIDYIAAGDVSHVPVGPGEAVRLMTGAPVPEGADAVTMYEITEFTDKEVTIFKPAKPGENIIHIGEDVKEGTLLAEAGMKIDSGLMGTLAGQNIADPLVYKQLKVGVMVTGSELVPVGTEPGPGMILDTNQYTLSGAMQAQGFAVIRYGIVADTMEAISGTMKKALDECDVLLMTGGASVGDYDLTPAAMEEVGVQVLFRNVQIKPGKACAYGVKDGKLVCGLSGHPSSSVLNLLAVGLAGIRKMTGVKEYMPKEIEFELMNDYPKRGKSDRAIRGTFVPEGGKIKIKIPEGQGNVMISGTIGTNCLAFIPAGEGPMKAGETIRGFLI